MSSITNTSTGEVELVDPIAIAYQAGGADVPVTAADPLPVTGTITTTSSPIEYEDSAGVDQKVTSDTTGAGGLPVDVQGGELGSVGTVGSVSNVVSVDTVDDVTTVGTVNTVTAVTTVGTVNAVTDVANVQSVDLVDSVTQVQAVDLVQESRGYHVQGGAAVATGDVNPLPVTGTITTTTGPIEFLDSAGAATKVGILNNRLPVTEHGVQTRTFQEIAVDVGPEPVGSPSGGKVFHTTSTWERISHVGILDTSTAGDVSISIESPGGGAPVYSGIIKVMPTSIPGSACMMPQQFSEPFNLGPGSTISVYHGSGGATVNVCFLVETLEP